jgi:type IV pilus assembly protein PilC
MRKERVMPNYKYKAQTLEGKKVSGKEIASNKQELYQVLKDKGLYLVSSDEIKEAKQNKKRIKTPALADFCRQLGTLLSAGVSLVRALTIIAGEEGLKPQYRVIYVDLLNIIRQGTTLSDAMEQQGEAFPPMLYYMIRSAEASGNVDKTALQMADYYTKEHKLNGKVTSAMIYPAILSVLIVGVVTILMVYVLPQFSDLFSQMDALPVSTTILMAISGFCGRFWYFVLIFVVFLVVLWKILMRNHQFRMQIHKLLLRIPKIGRLMKIIYTARFARTLSSLYSSGITMINALQIGKSTIGNTYIEDQFDEVLSMIRQGNPLSRALNEVDGFEKKLASTVLVGEETGSLNNMLDSIADSYEHEADLAITKLVSFIEPAMIVVMAVIVGFVMIAIIQPIYGSYAEIENSGANDYSNVSE